MEEDVSIPSMPGAFEPYLERETAQDISPLTQTSASPTSTTKQPKRRFIGRRTAEALKQSSNVSPSVEDTTVITAATKRKTPRLLNTIPASITEDPAIQAAIALLPPNYNFEIPKTIHRIRTLDAKRVALQMPEGLLMFATTISDILTQFCPGSETLIMGDVTYGACCIDDYTARALNCDLLVHYAHSCLIPISVEKIATLYIFVDITIDTRHLIATLTRNIAPNKTIAMVSTVQFSSTLHTVKPALEAENIKVIIPQINPLSKGEILGCTAPTLTNPQTKQPTADVILYLGDGRFHLEAIMIANPSIPAYRYDPYSRTLTRETYQHDEMLDARSSAISTAKQSLQSPSRISDPKPQTWGLILGSLGRQGNPHTLSLIAKHLDRRGIPYIELLLSEIFPGKLAQFPDVAVWVQIACPRLSVDWGYAFERPLLTPYEALVVLGGAEHWRANAAEQGTNGDGVEAVVGGKAYPMDYYSNRGLGRVTEKWANEVEIKG